MISEEFEKPATQRDWAWSAAETSLIVLLFFVLAGTAPPGVNEAHYLGKAKHYWNPQWCPGDLFLQSADAHLVFYWSFGWITQWLSLPAVAWVGRFLTWGLLAWSWRRLSVSLIPRPMVSVLTAGLFVWLTTCFHMAGEWMVGGFEAKGFAYPLVLLGLEALVRGRWNRVWLFFGAAASFHVLIGGWAVVAAALSWLVVSDGRLRFFRMLPALAGGFLLALPGLVPALALTWGVDSETVREANSIYVHQRLPHHLLFHRILLQPLLLDFQYLGLPPTWLRVTHLFFLRHLALFLCWLGLLWWLRPRAGGRRLHGFVAGVCAIAAAGIAIDQATLYYPELSARLLRYYWFRLSDVILPLGAALGIAQSIDLLSHRSPRWAARCLVGAVLVVTLFTADRFFRHRFDPRPEAVRQSELASEDSQHRFRDWLRLSHWVADYTEPDETFLTPRFQQTFRWYAQRGEVVTWKDVPQDARAIVQWWRRYQEVYPPRVRAGGLSAHGEQRLEQLARQYGFRYIVLDRSRSRRPLNFQRVYPPPTYRSTYEVYRLPDTEDEETR